MAVVRSLPWRGVIQFSLAIIATCVFIAIAKQMVQGDVDALDTSIALAIHRLDAPLLDAVMIAATTIGSGPFLLVAVIVTAAWALHHGHHRLPWILLAAGLAAQLLNFALKLLFGRARPTLWDEITRPDTFSFPSGHSMSAMVVFGAIAAVVIAVRPRWKWGAIACAALLILAIGFSRVYLGVHWPFDVLAGFAGGIPLLVVTEHLITTRNKNAKPRASSAARRSSPVTDAPAAR